MIFAETDRLILRRPRAEDYEPFLRNWADPEMTRYTGARDDVETFIAGLIAEMQVKQPGEQGSSGPWYQFAVEQRQGGALIGDVGIGFAVPGERQVEIGYRIHPGHQGRGYAREAVAAIIDYLVEEHSIHRFVGVSASANTASLKVLRSLGFRQEGRFRQSFLCNGQWLDDEYFALLASDWRKG